MNVRPPSWALKGDKCTYCEAGELVFSQCPACQVIVLICAECGTAYAIENGRHGREVGDTSGATRCFTCAGGYQHDFPPASSEAIRSLGFSSADYQ
jgi:hypothetical protein